MGAQAVIFAGQTEPPTFPFPQANRDEARQPGPASAEARGRIRARIDRQPALQLVFAIGIGVRSWRTNHELTNGSQPLAESVDFIFQLQTPWAASHDAKV